MDWQETVNEVQRLEAENAELRATVLRLGENAATAAKEYADNIAALRARRGCDGGAAHGGENG